MDGQNPHYVGPRPGSVYPEADTVHAAPWADREMTARRIGKPVAVALAVVGTIGPAWVYRGDVSALIVAAVWLLIACAALVASVTDDDEDDPFDRCVDDNDDGLDEGDLP